MEMHNPKIFISAVILYSLFFFGMVIACQAGGQPTASWYSVDSCLREGGSGIMANGDPLNDSAFTAASWNYPFGTMVEVQNINNGKTVLVEITDRGPAKSLYYQGRLIDLSKAAFQAIADLRTGVIPITVREVSNGS